MLMIDLYNNETNQLLGSIGEADLKVLIDALEEESSKDRDYYVDGDTIELLAEQGSPEMIALLRAAIGDSDGIEVRWARR
jgi:HEAT repeat protein